ncbi:MAG TPA: hypothetical protein VFB96_07895 [Pirellulaceae bacterium]|nr:hypothetical protein [Pirellulaceae bacterium]
MANDERLSLNVNTIATGLVAFTGISALLLIVLPLLEVPEELLMLLALAMCSGAVVSCIVIGARYDWLRWDRRRFLARSPLTDKEFMECLGGDVQVSPEVLHQVRQMAARCFGRLGDRLVPSDRLDEDLHLSDFSPWAAENFFDDLNEWIRPRLVEPDPEFRETPTFGEVVIEVQRLVKDARKIILHLVQMTI